MRTNRCWPLAIIGALSWSCASVNRAAQPPPIRKLDVVAKRLAQAAASNQGLALKVAGEVSYDGFSAPIWVVNRVSANPRAARVFLAGGIHGNEPAGVEALLRFIEQLADNELSELSLVIVPLVNPWGWVHNRRYNRSGQDINRDFSSYDSQEARIVLSQIEDREFALAADFHEDRSVDGFYLYQYSCGDYWFGRTLIRRQRARGFPIEQNASMVILETRDGLIDVPAWSIGLVKLARMLSMMNHMRLENSRCAYTIETPTKLPFEERVEMHLAVLNDLLRASKAERVGAKRRRSGESASPIHSMAERVGAKRRRSGESASPPQSMAYTE